MWLQDFAWTERDISKKLRTRAAKLPENPALASEPIFCFELAIRLFYWSCLVYTYEEASTTLPSKPARHLNVCPANRYMFRRNDCHNFCQPANRFMFGGNSCHNFCRPAYPVQELLSSSGKAIFCMRSCNMSSYLTFRCSHQHFSVDSVSVACSEP